MTLPADQLKFQCPGARKECALPRGWRVIGVALSALMILAGSGCALGLLGGDKPGREVLILVATPVSTNLNIGDPVVIEAVLISRNKKPLTLPHLSASSVTFWFTDKETGRMFKREPVVSPREDLSQTETLEPGQSWRRRFVLTQATESSGTLTAVLRYGSMMPVEGMLPGGEVTSDPFDLTVRGDQVLHRDAVGVLKRGDAVRIACKWAGMADAYAEATLVENEAGFLDWWVRLGPAQGRRFQKACLVNPYLGDVRAEVDPSKVPPSPKEPSLKAPPPKAPPQPLRDTQGAN